jgi:hypothetical protein
LDVGAATGVGVAAAGAAADGSGVLAAARAAVDGSGVLAAAGAAAGGSGVRGFLDGTGNFMSVTVAGENQNRVRAT